MSGKSHSFSVYLLKKEFNVTNALKEDHALGLPVEATELPEDAVLLILDPPPKPPWWVSFWGIKQDILQGLKGAILFLPVKHRTFAITFGHTYHNLKSNSYEYDFGLKVTLNSLDPKKLKSTDVLDPGIAKRQRIQSPVDSDLTFFDFDRDSSIIKTLAGKVKDEYVKFFGSVTGTSNLRISSKTTPQEIKGLCEQLVDIYSQETYKTSFPDLQNIAPVKDPSLVENLNKTLVEAFCCQAKELVLTIPKIVNYEEGLFLMFSGFGSSDIYPDVCMPYYHDYLKQNGVDEPTMETFISNEIVLCDEEGLRKKDRFAVHKCFLFETTFEDNNYHLCEGQWYYVDKEYLKQLKRFLDPYFEPNKLINYNHSSEGEYNAAVSKCMNDFICLDEEDISPKGQYMVEPCDLFAVEDDEAQYYHIKRSTRSSALSHLFNQGINSWELIRLHEKSKERMCDLIDLKMDNTEKKTKYISCVSGKEAKVVYGIITHKSDSGKSANLPLFSKISLKRTVNALQIRSVKIGVFFILDETERKNGKKKNKKKRKRTKD